MNFVRKDPMENYKIDFYTISNSIKTLLKKEIEKYNIKFIVDVDKEIFISGKSGELIQIFLNLLLNARDELIEDINNIDKKIELKAKQQGDIIIVEVIDNGRGITEDVKKHIFEPFYTTKLEGKGTGLGLSIVQNTIIKNNGKIEVFTEKDKGTKFIIKFPKY